MPLLFFLLPPLAVTASPCSACKLRACVCVRAMGPPILKGEGRLVRWDCLFVWRRRSASSSLATRACLSLRWPDTGRGRSISGRTGQRPRCTRQVRAACCGRMVHRLPLYEDSSYYTYTSVHTERRKRSRPDSWLRCNFHVGNCLQCSLSRSTRLFSFSYLSHSSACPVFIFSTHPCICLYIYVYIHI